MAEAEFGGEGTADMHVSLLGAPQLQQLTRARCADGQGCAVRDHVPAGLQAANALPLAAGQA